MIGTAFVSVADCATMKNLFHKASALDDPETRPQFREGLLGAIMKDSLVCLEHIKPGEVVVSMKKYRVLSGVRCSGSSSSQLTLVSHKV